MLHRSPISEKAHPEIRRDRTEIRHPPRSSSWSPLVKLPGPAFFSTSDSAAREILPRRLVDVRQRPETPSGVHPDTRCGQRLKLSGFIQQ